MAKKTRQRKATPKKTTGKQLYEPGTTDPETGRLILSANHHVPTAEAYIDKHHPHADGRTMQCQHGTLYEWCGSSWRELSDREIDYRLVPFLTGAQLPPDESSRGNNFSVNNRTITEARDAIKRACFLRESAAAPCWLDDSDKPPVGEMIIGKSTLWHIQPDGSLVSLEPTPALFAMNALTFNPNPHAAPPKRWLGFLDELFGDDHEQIQLLREYMGYALVADMSQEKSLLMVGPKRAGKGTIMRTLEAMVGDANCTWMLPESFGGDFGLQPLVGKSVVFIGDARFEQSGKTASFTGRLLSIVGRDPIPVNRKYRDQIQVQPSCRFVLATNELPHFVDASGALPSRFMVLRLTESFIDREDVDLGSKLLGELPGILNWAVSGLSSMRQRGSFVMPESSDDDVQQLADMASPVAAFIRECCEIGPEYVTVTGTLFDSWERWCKQAGVTRGSVRKFNKDIKSAHPTIETGRQLSSGGPRVHDGIRLRTPNVGAA